MDFIFGVNSEQSVVAACNVVLRSILKATFGKNVMIDDLSLPTA